MPLPDRTQWPRPAVAVATSEQTSAPGEPDSPPLDADWPWPAVAMANEGDSLVVTGFGRSSGAMATAAGRNNWPPVASATAGGSADRGSFSRASSGGLNLFFQDDKFWSEPAFLRMPPGAGDAAAEPPSGRTSPPPPPPLPLPMVPPPLPTSERPPAGDGGAPSEDSGPATEDQSTTGPSPAQDGA
ncbi:abl interactor homolog [Pollicipes pollicipes]|uniref:abl interactor homolog n=1 Tax=Pollicipes pollicipes TaxID=41117 RepID=UPI0018859C47|nr:abl interactor homolog [Pollicipes pollicipes]